MTYSVLCKECNKRRDVSERQYVRITTGYATGLCRPCARSLIPIKPRPRAPKPVTRIPLFYIRQQPFIVNGEHTAIHYDPFDWYSYLSASGKYLITLSRGGML